MQLPGYTVRDMILIALMAAIGIAIKPLVVPVVRVVAVPLGLPGGSLIGGIYMMWLVLGHTFTGKPWAATLVGVVQAGLAWAIGAPGPEGPWMLPMYMAPGAAADLALRLGQRGSATLSLGVAMLAGAAANATGIVLMCLIIYRIRFPVLVLSMAVGALSGSVGGVFAYVIHRRVARAAQNAPPTHGG